MVATGKMKFQAGGGIRSEQDVEQLLEVGVSRVVIGSLAVKQPELVKSWLTRFGAEQIVLALDINIDENGNKMLATHGWQESSDVPLESIVDDFLTVGLRHVLCTDISKDGTLSGPNQGLYKELSHAYPDISWQASGGMSCLEDIEQLKPSLSQSGLNNTTPSGVILGRALLEGKFNVKQALQTWLK
jgi:phosphoribosylformimino-5-aminoimidazole carboxamide ribotide isomerase